MSKIWKCPKCGKEQRRGGDEIGTKGTLTDPLGFLQRAIEGNLPDIGNTETCTNCGVKYNRDDVRNGKYDVPEPELLNQASDKTFVAPAEEINMQRNNLLGLLYGLPISNEMSIESFRCIRPGQCWPLKSEYHSAEELVDDVIESVNSDSRQFIGKYAKKLVVKISEHEGFDFLWHHSARHLRLEYRSEHEKSPDKIGFKGFWIIRAKYSFFKS